MSATEIKTVQLFCLGSLACLLATCNSLSSEPYNLYSSIETNHDLLVIRCEAAIECL